ncbi:bifunctional phosphopantothenoylcysteine decarboxylase/phosphopantothenate--cysteine ligase CoaBC [Bacillus salacetis]|uniref:Coenzyme A biosynthesis bifunctional protein CoaBC n=1 Tax=Bacillus salacetis TaxID=2315464 RepID=A0A3A1R352_9BACI|nr:bifunctional phosphopantothenoylcysteine decarboxylase/phosphopantothenate--cysteine ligase CoaBC [Bacillus salacetis]RIW36358.1 bifunctional phosphopantothenoylcysteine decarboxylase/phosphopantothenate--cysteine ligase CoaBC [Bacillus salacetis]
MVKGKNILLCVTGGIAVYKAAALTSKLVQAGAQVKVIMSASARQFVTPLTFQALSRNEVFTDTFDEKNPEVIAHIDLADWADLVLVAPATANVIGKLANGIVDDMVTTTLLATTAPVWIAPAMNVHMYGHPAVQKNISELYSFGYRFIEPSEGYLACGYVGKGRLEEPEKIIGHIDAFFMGRELPLRGKKVLVTAGPTREKVDPVRFFSNRSTGKMGFALAGEAVNMGAEVTLVTGPVSLQAPQGVNLVSVESAEEMYDEVLSRYESADIVIKSAAVADYRPKFTSDKKMKKQDGNLVIEFERTKDILKTLGEKKTGQLLVGFAAETNDVERYAAEKLRRKNADMIIANNVTVDGAGFAGDTNIVTLFKNDDSKRELPLLTKAETAREILNEIRQMMDEG